MYQAINAVYQKGAIVPLEPMALDENETVIVLRLQPVSTEIIKEPVEDRVANLARIHSARGAMKGSLSSVDEFIARKAEEKALEDR